MALFINVDGTNGSGKTSLVKDVTKELDEKGYSIYQTNEPGGTKIGMQIRSILMDNNIDDMDKITETLLFFADRSRHYHKVIKNNQDKDVIITDRYATSTYVYQHLLKGVDKELLDMLFKYSTNNLIPDLSFYIISDKPHGSKGDRLDNETLEFREDILGYFNQVAEYENLNNQSIFIETDSQHWQEYKDIMFNLIKEKIDSRG